jgi:hypothetical protein
LLIGLASVCCVLPGAQAQSKAGRGVCAAFGPDGSFAQARLSRTALNVEVSSTSGTPLKLAMPLILSGNTCHAFHSLDGQLFAVSIEDAVHPHANVQVAVADLQTGKWLQSAPYAATVAEDARGPLVGFLGDTHSLLLMSEGTYFPDEERSLLYPVMIDLPQGAVHVGLLGFPGPAFSPASGSVDGRNRKVWFSSRQDACGFGSQVLGDKDEVKPGASTKGEALRAQGCLQADHVLALTSSELIVGFSIASAYRIAAVDAGSGTIAAVTVKAKGREGFFKTLSTAISPESKVAAIEVSRFDDTLAGIKRSATEILVFQADPFVLAATLQVAEGTRLLAIHSRGGTIEVATLDKAGKIAILKAK